MSRLTRERYQAIKNEKWRSYNPIWDEYQLHDGTDYRIYDVTIGMKSQELEEVKIKWKSDGRITTVSASDMWRTNYEKFKVYCLRHPEIKARYYREMKSYKTAKFIKYSNERNMAEVGNVEAEWETASEDNDERTAAIGEAEEKYPTYESFDNVSDLDNKIEELEEYWSDDDTICVGENYTDTEDEDDGDQDDDDNNDRGGSGEARLPTRQTRKPGTKLVPTLPTKRKKTM